MSRLDDVNAFITQSRACRTADDLRRLMEGITAEMGFEAYALFQHITNFSWDDKTLLALSNYPRPWLDYFFEHRLTNDDPVLLASYRTAVGFRFADIPFLIAVTDRHRQILEAARREGITDGFCVPAHIPGEVEGSCTFTVGVRFPLPEANLPMAQLVGSFAYEAARRVQLAKNSIVRPVPGGACSAASAATTIAPITARQLECLALVARGKSDWEISRILGIGQETVKHHIRIARERYEVGTRIQAAIRAIADGQLSIYDVVR
jgi:LuxR family quorum-sensing system transcriptional regulator CciR